MACNFYFFVIFWSVKKKNFFVFTSPLSKVLFKNVLKSLLGALLFILDWWFSLSQQYICIHYSSVGLLHQQSIKNFLYKHMVFNRTCTTTSHKYPDIYFDLSKLKSPKATAIKMVEKITKEESGHFLKNFIIK